MRTSFGLAVALLAAFAASPSFADGMPPPGAPVGSADFSGIDVGVDLGAGIGSSGALSTSGFIGGAHLGYNLQNGPIVGGVEGDILYGDVSGGAPASGQFSSSWLDSLRGRAGYVFGPILAYGTLGWAYQSLKYTDPSGEYDKGLNGYVFGVGAEYSMMRNVSLRVDLRRYEFGSTTFVTPVSAVTPTSAETLLSLGVSAHF